MREIKFRAWDKKDNVMRQVNMMTVSENHNYQTYYFLEPTSENNGFRYTPDVELMQYTGLKDKNGKEIYEGDIIRHDWGLNKITFEDYSFTAEHIISFDGAFNCNLYLSDIGSDCEVIGNIYENPELIEKAQA
jgi:uncharacterized phage protein (TIGR01671 family)